jgi:hypothetical protein
MEFSNTWNKIIENDLTLHLFKTVNKLLISITRVLVELHGKIKLVWWMAAGSLVFRDKDCYKWYVYSLIFVACAGMFLAESLPSENLWSLILVHSRKIEFNFAYGIFSSSHLSPLPPSPAQKINSYKASAIFIYISSLVHSCLSILWDHLM